MVLHNFYEEARFRPGFFIAPPYIEIIYLLMNSLYITSDAVYQCICPFD